MWVRHLEVENFRNIERMSVELHPGFNFFFGRNGAGKTAILEAIHVLGRGRSFRTSHSQDLIRMGTEQLVLRADVEDEHVGTRRLAFAKHRGGQTRIRIDGEQGRKMSQLAAMLPLEVMTPSMVELVFGGPGRRRQWLDWGVFHVKHDHAVNLRQYTTALQQRNACLRRIALGKATFNDLSPWTREAASYGLLVSEARDQHLRSLNDGISACLRALGATFDVEMSYRQGWLVGAELEAVLHEFSAKDVKSGMTSIGPHRADMDLRVDGQPCGVLLSRGEAKVLASALMLAQADRIQAVATRTPLFLVDDIGAELDAVHRQRFFDALAGRRMQVLATSVEGPEQEIRMRCGPHGLFHVEHGRVDLTPRG